ncbi:MAG: hypothetical protein Q4D81_06255, partial [Eubacteriales bacterium]|nr:hypothetical protein [Eubacteriales bacterium]
GFEGDFHPENGFKGVFRTREEFEGVFRAKEEKPAAALPADGRKTVFSASAAAYGQQAAGDGLVLPAAMEAAGLMGGSIHARSAEGNTRFSFQVAMHCAQ